MARRSLAGGQARASSRRRPRETEGAWASQAGGWLKRASHPRRIEVGGHARGVTRGSSDGCQQPPRVALARVAPRRFRREPPRLLETASVPARKSRLIEVARIRLGGDGLLPRCGGLVEAILIEGAHAEMVEGPSALIRRPDGPPGEVA